MEFEITNITIIFYDDDDNNNVYGSTFFTPQEKSSYGATAPTNASGS